MLHHAVILPSDPSRLFKTFGSQRLYGSIQVGIQSRISGRAPSSNKGIVKERILPTYMAIDCASIFLWLNDNAELGKTMTYLCEGRVYGVGSRAGCLFSAFVLNLDRQMVWGVSAWDRWKWVSRTLMSMHCCMVFQTIR